MLISLLPILGLAAFISAAAIPSHDGNATFTPLVARDIGSCDDFNLPIEWYYNIGAETFCHNRFDPTPENPNPVQIISTQEPLVSTVVLDNYKSVQPVRWVYKIWIDPKGTRPKSQEVTYDKCMRRMKELLSEGQLGKAYCVVDGTEDVLFQANKIEEEIVPFAKLVFESYRRRG